MYEHMLTPDSRVILHHKVVCACNGFSREGVASARSRTTKTVFVHNDNARAWHFPPQGNPHEILIPIEYEEQGKMAEHIKREIRDNRPNLPLDYIWWTSPQSEWMVAFGDIHKDYKHTEPLNQHCAKIANMPAIHGAFVLLHGSTPQPTVKSDNLSIPSKYKLEGWRTILRTNSTWVEKPIISELVTADANGNIKFGSAESDQRHQCNPWHTVMLEHNMMFLNGKLEEGGIEVVRRAA